MQKRNIIHAILVLFFVVQATAVFGAIIPFHTRISTPHGGTAVQIGQPEASDVISISSGGTNPYVDRFVKGIISFGVDHHYPTILPSMRVKVELFVQRWSDASLSAADLTDTTIFMEVSYSPMDSLSFLDKQSIQLNGVEKYTLEIVDIWVDGSTVTDLPANLFIDADIYVDRYFDFTDQADDLIVPTHTAYDLNCDEQMDRLTISWPAVVGAEGYQLEWAYINDYGSTSISFIDADELPINFKLNSTRISSSTNFYDISLTFDRGYICYRVRAIGRNISNLNEYIFGAWSSSDEGMVNDMDHFHQNWSFEGDKNWQYSTSYAEEGKKKEVVSFFDGSLRNRQMVTKINSDNHTIVGETIYDHQGRPAIQVLPVPVSDVDCENLDATNVLQFYPNFNLNTTGIEYSRMDFDLSSDDPCTVSSDNMNPIGGASNYYSDLNPNQTGSNAFIPDADGRPFTQVEYTPDNTGRIRRQSGVGEEFKLGSNHETKYYYSKPTQVQLDRMFGSEVGIASHYQKNMVVDPNGQVSVSYLDQEGRVIATSLAGEVPDNFKALESAASGVVLTDDLFATNALGETNLNVVNAQGTSKEFSEVMAISSQTEVTFNYNLVVDTLFDPCLAEGICFTCVYDLSLQVFDECGLELTADLELPVQAGRFEVNETTQALEFLNTCSGEGSEFTFDPGLTFTLDLGIGTYTIVKTLTVNEAAKDFYVETYLDSNLNTCIKTLHDFEQEYLSNVDFSDCDWEESCEACLADLGSLEDFIANGLGSATDYKVLRDACLEPCYEPSMCDNYRDIMLGDMSPGGQYAEYTEATTNENVYAFTFPVSVLNENNSLAFAGSWKEPKIWIEGILHENYFEADSITPARVSISSVVFDVDGVTIIETVPPVADFNEVYFENTTNSYYTAPQNLSNLGDFLATWQNSYAASLLVYHPEYHFYSTCLEYQKPLTEGDAYTSESFDQLISRIETWDDAVLAGLIRPTYATEPIVLDRLTEWFNSGAHAWDPFMAYESTHFDGLGAQLRQKMEVYQVIDGVPYSMPEIAALMTRCGTQLLSLPVVSSCTKFGDDFGLDADENDEMRDLEWQRFRALYISEKQALQHQLGVDRSLNDPNYYGYNGCIGNEDFNPFLHGFAIFELAGSPPDLVYCQYFNEEQPCNFATYSLYRYKQKRFAVPADLMSLDANQMAFQNYMMTGQCPITANLQSLFNEIAVDGKLSNTSILLDDYEAFTGSILAISGYNFENIYDPIPSIEWQQTNLTSTTLEVDLVVLPSTTLNSFQLELPTSMPISFGWNDIQSLYGMQFVSESGGVYSFDLKATVLVGTTTFEAILTGMTGINIQDCQFQEVCTRNDLGIQLPVLMSALAQQNKLASTLNVQVLGGSSIFEPFVTPTVQAAISPSSITTAFWKYEPSLQSFQLFESSSTQRLDLHINSIEPSSFSFANLNLIKGFSELIPTHSNSFDLIAVDGSGNYLATLKCDAIYWDNTTSTQIAVGTCSQTTPKACEGDAFDNTENLGALLVDVLNNQEYDAGDGYNLAASSYFTLDFSSYFGTDLNPSISQYNSFMDGDTLNEFVGIVNGEMSCKIKLTHKDFHPTPLTWDDLVSVSDFTPYGERDEWGDFHTFYLLATFDTGSGTFEDTIFGSSCMPLNVCRLCANEVPGSGMMGRIAGTSEAGFTPFALPPSYLNCEELYDFYLNRYNEFQQAQQVDLSCEDYATAYPILSFQEFLDANICCSQDNIQAVLDSFIYQFYTSSECPEISLPTFDSCTAYIPQNYPCRDAYYLYLSALDAYNFSPWAQANSSFLSYDQFSSVEDFYTSGKCYCFEIYLSYLSTYINADSTEILPSPQALLDFSACQYNVPEVADTCVWFYTQYLNAYGQYQESQLKIPTCENYQTLYPPHSYQDFVDNNLCCSIDNLFASASFITQFTDDSTECPLLTLPLFDSCGPTDTVNEPCLDQLVELLVQLDAYNNSAWAQFTKYYIHYDIVDFTDKCACIQTYIDYLQPYIEADISIKLPSPYPFFESHKCASPPDPKPCRAAYNTYKACVENFTSWAVGASYPVPTLIEYIDFVDDNLCWCVDDYCAYLNDVMDGFISEVEYGSGQSIADRCAENTQQPCQPDSVPTWGGPTVLDSLQTFNDPCTQILTNAALANAWEAYHSYLDSIKNSIASRYYAHCLSATETFTRSYSDNEYHRTLYYYDQAGNLIKTIPPAGVNLVNTTSSADAISIAIANDRLNGTHSILTSHRLATTYMYNSLNQLIRQNTPDQDAMDIWEITLPNGLYKGLTTTSIQMVNSSLGYLTGNITTALGQKRGFLYRTDNGGVNWKKMNNTVATDLVKIEMASTLVGYAVGKYGAVLKTVDGGSSWDLLDTYTSIGYTTDLNDLFVASETDVTFLGKSGLSFSTTDGGANFTTALVNLPFSVSGFVANAQSLNEVSDGKVLELSILDGSETYDAFLHADNGAIEPVKTQDYSFIIATDATHAFAGHNGMLVELETPSSGTNFKQQTVPLDRYHQLDQCYFFTRERGMMNEAGSLFFTVDGGRNWTLFDDQSPINRLSLLKKSATQLELMASGDNGLSKRILFSLNSEPQYVDHTNYLAPQALNLTHSSLFTETNGKRFVVAADDGKLYVSSLVQTGVEAVTYSPIGQLNPSDPAEQVRDLILTNMTGASVAGVIVSDYGSLYSLHRTTSLSAFTITPISIGISDPEVTAIYLNETDKHVYAFEPSDRNLYRIELNALTAVSSGTSLANALPGSFDVRAMTQHAGRVTIAGDGELYTSNDISGTNTLTTWDERSSLRIKHKVNAVEVIAGDVLEAVGDNGFVAVRYGSGSSAYWQMRALPLPVAVDISAVAVNSTHVFGVGSNGTAFGFELSTQTQFNIQLADGSVVDHTTFPNTRFTSVAMEGNTVYICGNNGTMLYSQDFTTAPFYITSAGAYPGVDFTSVSMIPSYGAAYAVGNNSKIYRFVGITGTEVKNVFTEQLSDVHFADAAHGSLLGDRFFVRQTNDGGATWDVVMPENDVTNQLDADLKRIWTVDENYAVLVGDDHLSEIKNGFSTKQTVSGTPDFNAIQFASNSPLNGFVARGGSVQKIALTPASGSYTVALGSTYTPSVAPTAIRALHVFENGNVMAVGTDRFVNYMSNAGTFTPYTSGLGSGSETFHDVFFHDDVVGYVVGDAGLMYRSENVQINATTYAIEALAWGQKNTADNEVVDPSLVDIYALAFSSRYLGVWGGSPISASNTAYVRRVKDESSDFDSRFFYDRLGRLVVSQNARQYNQQKFSYSLYDALGRVYEAGEKSENETDELFANIFGTNVGGQYIPTVIDDEKLEAWIDGDGQRHEVTRSYYDETVLAGLPVDFTPNTQTQRKRITHVTYEAVYDGDDQTYDHATHYNYDIHGNVKTLLQDNPILASDPMLASQQFKRMDYNFDLVSGNVHRMSYQQGKADQWHHAYVYDADNRITQTFTTKTTPLTDPALGQVASQNEPGLTPYWEKEAQYTYYAHGPLSRTELGQHQVQGLDYVYTMQGWLKGVNSNTLDPTHDPGAAANTDVMARDVMGYSLHYFANDYAQIGSGGNAFVADQTGSDLVANSDNLYNGNIGKMVTTITNPNTREILPLGNAYKYDQLNRLSEARSFTTLNLSTNTWDAASSYDGKYFNAFSYDANGNILGQLRNDATGAPIDSLSYKYKRNSLGDLVQNRLYHVKDQVASGDFADDIDNMGVFYAADNVINTDNNYVYDEEGRLVKDEQEEIEQIVWRVDGKVLKIIRPLESTKKNLIFEYDAMGNRIAKHVLNSSDVLEKSTYYVLDASGNTLSVYERTVDEEQESTAFYQAEKHIYGSSRLGMLNDSISLLGSENSTYSMTLVEHQVGKRIYELSNHLGNVLTTITDKTKPVDDDSDDEVDWFVADIYTAQDYSPFGVTLEGRKFEATIEYCHDEVSVSEVFALDEEFELSTSLLSWTAMNSGALAYFDEQMQVANPTSTPKTIGVYRTFTTGEGLHAVNFDITTNTCATVVFWPPSVTPRPINVYIRDQYNNIVASGSYTTSGSYSLSFTPSTSAATYKIEFYMTSASAFCFFQVDNVKIEHEVSTTTSVCVEVPVSYRYGYQGSEKDDEIKGGGNSYTTQFRQLDPRLGRWLSIDPKASSFPWQSPYCSMDNNPISLNDQLGLETKDWIKDNKTGKYTWDKNVTSEANTPSDHKYIGKENSDIVKDLVGKTTFTGKTENWGTIATDSGPGWVASSKAVVFTKLNVNISANVSYEGENRTFNGIDVQASGVSYTWAPINQFQKIEFEKTNLKLNGKEMTEDTYQPKTIGNQELPYKTSDIKGHSSFISAQKVYTARDASKNISVSLYGQITFGGTPLVGFTALGSVFINSTSLSLTIPYKKK